MPAALFPKYLQDRPRAAEALLRRLVWVGGRANGNAVALIDLPQFAFYDFGGRGFRVNPVFEFRGVFFHELVRIPRIAVFAAEFASAIGVNRPAKRHAGLGPV